MLLYRLLCCALLYSSARRRADMLLYRLLCCAVLSLYYTALLAIERTCCSIVCCAQSVLYSAARRRADDMLLYRSVPPYQVLSVCLLQLYGNVRG
jgi:hypothetical protein